MDKKTKKELADILHVDEKKIDEYTRSSKEGLKEFQLRITLLEGLLQKVLKHGAVPLFYKARLHADIKIALKESAKSENEGKAYNAKLEVAELLEKTARDAQFAATRAFAEAHAACPECKGAGGYIRPEDACPLCGCTVFDSAHLEDVSVQQNFSLSSPTSKKLARAVRATKDKFFFPKPLTTCTKPKDECVGCGYCCSIAICTVGRHVFNVSAGEPCPGLVKEGDIFRCSLAEEYGEELNIGTGCSSNLNSRRKEMLNEGR